MATDARMMVEENGHECTDERKWPRMHECGWRNDATNARMKENGHGCTNEEGGIKLWIYFRSGKIVN
ncbi:MAG: hypothetical protein JSS98_04215 [Bacteroidetes bacterium]|nr:hypothetical protein [Bacteroidota bacterium]